MWPLLILLLHIGRLPLIRVLTNSYLHMINYLSIVVCYLERVYVTYPQVRIPSTHLWVDVLCGAEMLTKNICEMLAKKSLHLTVITCYTFGLY